MIIDGFDRWFCFSSRIKLRSVVLLAEMIFPISDDDSGLKRFAWVTILFILINIAVFLYQQSNPPFTSSYSAVPAEITTGKDLVGEQSVKFGDKIVEIEHGKGPSPIFLTLLTSMFMHGGWMHLGFNMLFLWVFGDNVENRFGWVRFIIFYVVSGLVATFAHIMLDPDSKIPMLGASGAIAGVLGAYLVMFPRNKVNALFFVKIISLPAFIVIGLWGILQVVSMMGLKPGSGGGVAYAAHVGGLVAGIVLGLAFRFILDREPDRNVLYQNYRRDDKAKKIW